MRKLHYSIIKRLNLLFRREYSMVKRNGVWLMLNKTNWIDNRLLSFRGYEPGNLHAMQQLIAAHSITHFYDIGANIGYFTAVLGQTTSLKEIHAYEPMRRNAYQLGANILLNDLCARVTCHTYALGDEEKSTTLWYNAHSTGIATLDRSATPRAEADYTLSETIECRVFDRLHTLAGHTVLIKMDVEGYEKHALLGMREFIHRNRVFLFVEINQDDEEVLALLHELGLTRMDIAAEDYVFSNAL